MASFLSTMTEIGAEIITKFLASGQELLLSRAEAGDGIAGENQNMIAKLVNRVDVDIALGEKSFVKSDPSYMLIPVHISNKNLTEKQYIREIILYALDENGSEFPFVYSWLDGEDTDNVLPATTIAEGDADTVHIHDLAIIATDQINAIVRVAVGGGGFVTRPELHRAVEKHKKIYIQAEAPVDTGEFVWLKLRNVREVVAGDEEPEQPEEAESVVFITTEEESDVKVEVEDNTHNIENATTDPTQVQEGTYLLKFY